jgi:hypothetical protein
MLYAVEMGSRAMTYIPTFIKISSRIQKLLEDVHTQTHSRYVECIGI